MAPLTCEQSTANWRSTEKICSLIVTPPPLLASHSVMLISHGRSCWLHCSSPELCPPMDSGQLQASEPRLQTQPCLHNPSSRPPECLSAPSPSVCFMGVLNHSTHHGAEEKLDLLDLPAWYLQSESPILNDFLSSCFFRFIF